MAGLARVASASHPDRSALDPSSHYYDEKASEEDPRWFLVEIEFVERFPRVVTLDELRRTPGLEKMLVINKSRLSVQPVTQAEYDVVVGLGRGG